MSRFFIGWIAGLLLSEAIVIGFNVHSLIAAFLIGFLVTFATTSVALATE